MIESSSLFLPDGSKCRSELIIQTRWTSPLLWSIWVISTIALKINLSNPHKISQVSYLSQSNSDLSSFADDATSISEAIHLHCLYPWLLGYGSLKQVG